MAARPQTTTAGFDVTAAKFRRRPTSPNQKGPRHFLAPYIKRQIVCRMALPKTQHRVPRPCYSLCTGITCKAEVMRVAVVAAAHELARSGGARVAVYEKEDHLGGNGSNTMAVDDGAGGRVHVDLGSMVFNRV
ncbi:hypothetical protein HU200_061324 [Digitaria exilis]|uniref:Uncharacterized protein n=1 Tax=Digitaria exilis TaxID=1010633 RepID=A0A835E1H0_9POAL|nr:hypothetical protein HU200_061324 [Digitaria exilis]